MDEVLNKQRDSSYATPFNVDFSGPKPKNFFAEYTMKVLSLPESIKNILMDSSTAEFIEENLGPNFNLTPEQKTEITRIIRDVLLGDASLTSMPSLISSKLNTDQNTSVQIANKIVNDLFGSAIEDIKKLQADSFPEKITSRPVMPPRPQTPRIPEKPDLKIEPDINRNNVVDLRNK
ncbi:MAG: hypothetical protein Q7K11_00515 [Candidatus Berkelbacteria bacterium]|nr:hypothetical protein [Candidatus Berkelbacteria bacterium]